MGEFSPWHLLILAGVFVLLFGAKRLPDGARSLGRSLRIFKTEVKGLGDDDKNQADAAPVSLTAAPAAPPVAPVAPGATAVPPATPPVAEPADPATAARQQHEAR